jgi:hypothetical protein
MSLDAVERVRLVRDVVLRTVSDQRPISPAVADSALRQLADPRLSTYDVLSVSKEIIDVTLTPRKVARVHDEQVKEDKEKTALPGEGLAPKLFQRNLSYKDNINSVGQVKQMQATNEPTDKKKKKNQDDNSLTIRLRLLSHSSSGRKNYEIVKDTMSIPKLPSDSAEASLTPLSPIPSTVALLSPPRSPVRSSMSFPSMLTVPTLSAAFGSISAKVSSTRKYRQQSETQSPNKKMRVTSSATNGDLSNQSNLYAIDKVCEKSVCLRLLMIPDSTSRSIFCSTLSSKLSGMCLLLTCFCFN